MLARKWMISRIVLNPSKIKNQVTKVQLTKVLHGSCRIIQHIYLSVCGICPHPMCTLVFQGGGTEHLNTHLYWFILVHSINSTLPVNPCTMR